MGTYIKNTYEDRIVEFPNRFMETNNGDGTVIKTRDEGLIINEGTPITVNKLNNLENGIFSAHNQIDGNNTGQHPDSIQKQVNAIASKSKLIKADILPGDQASIIFSENLMPGEYLRFIARGNSLTLLYIDEISVDWVGNKLFANKDNTKFTNKNYDSINYAPLIDNISVDPYVLVYGEIKMLNNGQISVSAYQTMSSTIDTNFYHFFSKSVLLSETLYNSGIGSITLRNYDNDVETVCYLYSDSKGEVSCDIM